VEDLRNALALKLDDPVDRELAQRLIDRLSPPVALKSGPGAPGTGRRGLAEPGAATRAAGPLFDATRLIDQLFSDDAQTRVRATSQVVLLAPGDASLLPELLDRASGATADLGVTLNVLATLTALPPERVARHREEVLHYLDAAREAGPQAADFATLIRSTLGE
jgi:hypothetical protein